MVDVFTIWDGLNGRKKHLFSSAGFLSLKDPRFNWLRGMTRRRLDRKKGMVRLLDIIIVHGVTDDREKRGKNLYLIPPNKIFR